MADFINCSIEIRQDETNKESPGRLRGVLMRYGVRAQDRPEVFKPGSLEWDASGIVLNESHDRKQPIIRVIPETRNNEVILDIALPDTQRGRDASTLIKNGTFTGLSVEFRAIAEKMVNGIREITKARLFGAGLVDCPSYAAAKINVRQKQKQNYRRRLWL